MTTQEKIKKARLADPPLTQQQVADAVGVNRSMIALWELGHRRLSVERAAQLASAIERMRDAQRFANSVLTRAAEESRRQAAAL